MGKDRIVRAHPADGPTQVLEQDRGEWRGDPGKVLAQRVDHRVVEIAQEIGPPGDLETYRKRNVVKGLLLDGGDWGNAVHDRRSVGAERGQCLFPVRD